MMGYLESELEKRGLPPLMQLSSGEKVADRNGWDIRREEIKEILTGEFAGIPCRFPVETVGKVTEEEKDGYGGKAWIQTVWLQISSPYASCSFPFRIAVPKEVENPPVFFYLSFSPEIADGLGEEIIDSGYAAASVYYQDMAPDYYDGHKNGIGRFVTRNPYDSWGKLRIWAWGVSRMFDYLETQKIVDLKRAAVMGHSRLGKTALVAGAFDERFSLTVANESGAGGAALFRGKTGERIENLYGKGSRLWFAGNFFAYTGREEELPFDQHYLLGLIAPRRLYVASAARDDWSDPRSEFLGCVAASEAYRIYGKKGLVTPDQYPEVPDTLHEGEIGYHIRKGTHYLSRYDWQQVIAYRRRYNV